MKIKEVKGGKHFNYSVNRKRVDKKIRGTGRDPLIRKAGKKRKTMTKNLNKMRLSRDPNKIVSTPSMKQRRQMMKLAKGFVEEDIIDEAKPAQPKSRVVEQLEQEANEYRESLFRQPESVVKYASYLLDTYGLNYKAMVKDEKNYDKETWRQFRSKIRKFRSIPEQFDVYVKERNLDPENLGWSEYKSDDDLD